MALSDEEGLYSFTGVEVRPTGIHIQSLQLTLTKLLNSYLSFLIFKTVIEIQSTSQSCSECCVSSYRQSR